MCKISIRGKFWLKRARSCWGKKHSPERVGVAANLSLMHPKLRTVRELVKLERGGEIVYKWGKITEEGNLGNRA